LWKSQVFFFRVQNSPPRVLTMSHIKSVHTLPYYFFNSTRSSIPSSLCPSNIITINLYTGLFLSLWNILKIRNK
jgi:hypothetical protein